MGSTRRLIAAIGATVLLSVSLAACSHSSGSDGSGGGANPTAAPKQTPTTLPSAEATKLTTALTSKKAATIATVLAPEVKAAFLKSPQQLLPAGSKLEIQSDKMLVSGDAATVPVKITGGKEAGTWLLSLEKSGDQWLLVGTVKQ